MNLLEHYIVEIHSVTDVTNEYEQKYGTPCEPLYKVDLTYDCYGAKEREPKLFFKSDWERIKNYGYFLA